MLAYKEHVTVMNEPMFRIIMMLYYTNNKESLPNSKSTLRTSI